MTVGMQTKNGGSPSQVARQSVTLVGHWQGSRYLQDHLVGAHCMCSLSFAQIELLSITPRQPNNHASEHIQDGRESESSRVEVSTINAGLLKGCVVDRCKRACIQYCEKCIVRSGLWNHTPLVPKRQGVGCPLVPMGTLQPSTAYLSVLRPVSPYFDL